LTSLAACGRGPSSGTPLAIALRPSHDDRPALVEITGFSSSELAGARSINAGAWPSLFTVTVDAADPVAAAGGLPPVEGRYAVTSSAVTFTPLFPFDPGRSYRVAFDPGRLPTPRSAAQVTRVVGVPAAAANPTTRVLAVHPASPVWPANTLRLYIEFSAPMGRGAARDFVRLLDEMGHEVPLPFLPVDADLWNADRTRATVFFDPGRVKQGILPNRQMGRPLEQGREYTIEVSGEWKDVRAQGLAASYQRRVRVGAAAVRPLSMASWTIAAPSARTRDGLVVSFPAPLDHGLIARAISVESAGRSIEGDIRLDEADTRWTFTPRASWEAGAYELVALSILEDPAGNRIGRAFEVDTTAASDPAAPDRYQRPFTIVALP
jgi:hypothetical protein